MYLGIDVGGTKTLIALFSENGRIIQRIKFPTAQDSAVFLDDLSKNLKLFLKHKSKINSIVTAIPGLVQNNYSVQFGNRDWRDIDLIAIIKNLFSCPIAFENDASLGALFEGRNLPGKIAFLTFSTGIGGGLIENNQLLPESGTFEPGHWLYEYDGVKAEWEDIAAASALEKAYGVTYATNIRKKTQLEDTAKRVYLGLPDVIDKYNPDTVILGGPLGKIFSLYTKYLPKILNVNIVRPKRPTESTIYGCYILAKQKAQNNSR